MSPQDVKFFFFWKLLDTNYEKKSDSEFNDFLKTIPELLKTDTNFEELLTKNESSDLKNRYNNKVAEIYEDALRRHVGIFVKTFFD